MRKDQLQRNRKTEQAAKPNTIHHANQFAVLLTELIKASCQVVISLGFSEEEASRFVELTRKRMLAVPANVPPLATQGHRRVLLAQHFGLSSGSILRQHFGFDGPKVDEYLRLLVERGKANRES